MSVWSSVAISGTKGSSGLGSVRRLDMESRSLLMVRAGLQLSFRISRHMPPLELILQWQMRVLNFILGGLKGYSVVN